jgi:hypothetical protein
MRIREINVGIFRRGNIVSADWQIDWFKIPIDWEETKCHWHNDLLRLQSQIAGIGEWVKTECTVIKVTMVMWRLLIKAIAL